MNLNISQPFNFFPVPTDIHFGFGVLSTLPDRIKALGGGRAFLVTDPGIRDAGIVDRVVEAAKLDTAIYDRVTPDSGTGQITEAVDAMKDSGADVVIGVGGGSALDTAKAVAALATNPGSPLDYVGLHKIRNRPLPMIAIPTTSGTGSEVTLWSVFTNDDNGLKVAIGSTFIYPAVALCDPALTMDLPPALTAATGMDALAHALECYTNNACQPLSGALAYRAMELIGANLRPAVLNGRDRESRYAMMLGSTMAGIAMNPTRLGLAHALAMPLGSWDLHIPHGVAIAVTLAPVMAFNHTAAPRRYAEVAQALGEHNDPERSVEAVERLANDVGIPKTLPGIREDHVNKVVTEAMKSGNVVVNPRRTCAGDLANILRSVIQ